MHIKGRMVFWDDEKGYGFVESPSTGRVFVHINAFANRSRRPSLNQSVTFALSTDKQGRKCAVNAALVGDPMRSSRRGRSGSGSVVMAMLFMGVLSASVAIGKVPPWVLGVYLALSLITAIVYALDKAAAKRGAWRTRESNLHLLSLVGGWPGALVAQQIFRHKSKKKSFRTAFWMTAVLNCAVFGWLLTPSGAEALRSLLINATKG